MHQKQCYKCSEIKLISDFSKDKNRKDGLYPYCKSCQKERFDLWASKKENRNTTRKCAAKYYSENKDKCKEYQIKNKKKRSDYMKKWRKKKSEHCKKYKKEYHEKIQSNDINYKLLHSLRGRLNQAVKGGKKWARTLELTGCDIQTLKAHLESKFSSRMSWDNYGLKGWHIDHIKPCDSFDLTIEAEQRKCFHYTNLQPLWWLDNCTKSNSLTWHPQSSCQGQCEHSLERPVQ